MEQHSKEWFLARLGVFTGSEVGKLMVAGRTKGEPFGETAKDYIFDKVSERLLREEVTENNELWMEYYNLVSISSKAMDFGTEQEPYARKRYKKITGNHAFECGFYPHKEIPNFGTSPDGIVVQDGEVVRTVEIKCPLGKTYIKYASQVVDGTSLKKVNSQYYWQTVSHCMCTGAGVCDFVIYNPFLRQDARIKIVPIVPTDEDIALLEERVLLADEYAEGIVSGIVGK